MPHPSDLRVRTEPAGGLPNGHPGPRPYTWHGAPPDHPGLCGGCGYLITAKAHYYMCGDWQQDGREWRAEHDQEQAS